MSRKRNTSALALSGIMLAITLVLNIVASFHLFRLDVIFYVISGALVYFIAVRNGLRIGIFFYIAAAILSFVIVPDKAYIMFFIGVFGPCAIIQAAFFKAESNKKIGRFAAALLFDLVFIILFFIFAFVVAYAGGFLEHLGLSTAGTTFSMPTAMAIAFGLFSAIVAYLVNRNLWELIEQRTGGKANKTGEKSGRAGSPGPHIDLPKLYNEDEE